MKIIKLNFLGKDYEFKCEEKEVSKIKNSLSRLNNKVHQVSKINYNYSDTHKLLITALNLEDQINENLQKQKNLINKIDQLSLENKELSTKVNINLELEKSIENIQMKIKKILKKLN